jgi:hypothetical protein
MEMQQIVQMLAKLQASQDIDREERKADKEELIAKMDSNQKKAEADKEEMLARMKEDRKADQEKMTAKQEDLLARMDKMDAKMAKADKQEEIMGEINTKMDATIQSIRSEVQETIHNRVEKVREELNKKKRGPSTSNWAIHIMIYRQ